jgi:hypothetical protein
MDFFSILQQNSNENLLQKNSKKELNKKIENEQIYHTNSYKNLIKGNLVKIIGIKNSTLNVYKGYIGEIKDYKKDQDFAIIFLYAIQTNAHFVKFPINHFIVTD